MPVFSIPKDEIIFPHPSLANEEGLLGIGGDLTPERLLLAYRNGIFPWYNVNEPIMWWCLTPRLVLYPEQIIISKSMKQLMHRHEYRITVDQCFEKVMSHCRSVKREGQKGSWIHYDILEAYSRMHELGIAHSVEVWHDDNLVGGLYGLAIGKMFCGESMFAEVSNASKLALIHLCQLLPQKGITLIDCQQETQHLKSMGAVVLSADDFFSFLEKNKNEELGMGKWG